jgi:hypothetical protein
MRLRRIIVPIRSQGDVFQAAQRVQLAIAFGHVGFTQMKLRWDEFREGLPELSCVYDPFTKFSDQPIEWSHGRWLMFFGGEENHAMTDNQLTESLNNACSWATEHNISSIATNGIVNVDRNGDHANVIRSDRQRAEWLVEYATQVEIKYGISIELISLDDVFTRAPNDE